MEVDELRADEPNGAANGPPEDTGNAGDFIEYATRLLEECDKRVAAEEAQPFRPAEISRLYLEIHNLSATGQGLSSCPTETLLSLLQHLRSHIKEGAELNILDGTAAALKECPELGLGEWMATGGEGNLLLQRALMALEAAGVALLIITAQDADRRLLMEELMDEIVDLLKRQINSHLLPSFEPSFTNLPGVAPGNDDEGDDDEESEDDQPPPTSSRGASKSKARRSKSGSASRSRESSDIERRFRPVLKQLMRTTTKVHELLDLLEVLVTSIRVDDRLLLKITPICMTSLGVDSSTGENVMKLQPVQHSAMSLLQTIFGEYSQHRNLMIEDVFSLFLKLPAGKRHLRTFRLHYRAITLGVEGQNIQLVTALVMLLLQSVVSKPSAMLDQLQKGESPSARDKRPEGDEAVVGVAHRFAQSFLERCGRKEQGSEFRTLLGNLVEDLLTAFLLPEWPAAELLLQAFCILLLKDLYNTKSTNAESIYFLQSLDLLGKILSKLRELLRGVDDVEAHLGKVLADELRKAVVEGSEVPEDEGRVVVDWFKRVLSKRVEAMEVEPLPKLLPASQGGGKSGGSSKSRKGRKSQTSEVLGDDEETARDSKPTVFSTVITDKDAARQLVMNYLSVRAEKGDAWVRFARRLYLCGWISGSTGDGINHHPQYWAFLEEQWEIPPRTAMLTEDLYHCLSAEATIRLSHALATGRTLLQSFDGLLYRLLALLGQGQATWRARVMKAFTSILEADPMLMAQEKVKQAVIDRFQDEATSVRQATVDLVGKYVLQRPQLFEKYYEALIERLVDKGVSVRKTVVRIFGEFLPRFPTHALRTEICRRLVERASVVKEEDTVKDLIRDTFQVMWFSDQAQGGAVPNADAEDLNGERKRGSAKASHGMSAVALQMVEVIAGLQNTDWLVALLHGLLFGPGEGEQEKKERVKQRKAINKRCESIVESLVGVLLDLDEGAAPPLNAEIPELASPAKQLLAVISTLYVFSRANAAFLIKHVDTLLPYLKAENHLENHEEALVCHMVSSMVALVIPHLEKPDRPTFMQAVKDLTQITYKFPSTAIHSAVECMANLDMFVTKDPTDVLKLANTFYGVLRRFQDVADFRTQGSTTRSSAHRGLVVLGCVCRYYKFKNQLDKLLAPAAKAGPLPKELTEANIYEASYRLFSTYLTKDVDTEVQAVQAICSLFTGCMQLMLTAQRDGVIGRIIRSKENVVKLTALRSFRDVLTAEEKRVESGAARETMAKMGVSLKQRVKGDQDAEASIVGGVIQEHIDTIMTLLLDRDSILRSAALALLSVLHRQGLVNPLQTMPTLLALQGDPSPAVRGDAYRQLLIETEKHPEYISNRAMDGLCLSYSFQKNKLERVSTRMDEKDSSANGTQCIFGPIYASSMRSNRKYRFQFLRNLLALFEEKTANEQYALAGRLKPDAHKPRRASTDTSSSAAHTSTYQKGSLDPGFLAYAAKIVAYLPFEVQEEPLFVIYHISRLVSLEGSALLSEVKSLFQRAGLRLSEDHDVGKESHMDDDDSDGDETERTPAGSKANGDGAVAMEVEEDEQTPVNIPPALLSALKDKCAACMAFCALLRVKFFLKNVYHLNDDKCLEYKPQEGAIKNERPLTKPDVLPELDLPENLVVSLTEGPKLTSVLKMQFQEFRKLIRGDPADFKLHKPVRSSKGRKSSTGGADLPAVKPRSKRASSTSAGGSGKKGSKRTGRQWGCSSAKKRRGSGGRAVADKDDESSEESDSRDEEESDSSEED